MDRAACSAHAVRAEGGNPRRQLPRTLELALRLESGPTARRLEGEPRLIAQRPWPRLERGVWARRLQPPPEEPHERAERVGRREGGELRAARTATLGGHGLEGLGGVEAARPEEAWPDAGDAATEGGEAVGREIAQDLLEVRHLRSGGEGTGEWGRGPLEARCRRP